jgi:hypothetical protein
MAYPGMFHRLVIAGSLYNDIWNTSLSIVPPSGSGSGMPAVTDARLAAVAADVSNWWTGGGAFGLIPISSASVKSIKLNRIGPDGLYQDNETKEHIYPVPLVGGGSPGAPPQLAVVATLRTDVERGLASKGRMYLPPCAGFTSMQADGRAQAGDALRVAGRVINLVQFLNTTYGADGKVGVASSTRGGAFRIVQRVTVGRVVDTMRSRRSTQIEAPVGADIDE